MMNVKASWSSWRLVEKWCLRWLSLAPEGMSLWRNNSKMRLWREMARGKKGCYNATRGKVASSRRAVSVERKMQLPLPCSSWLALPVLSPLHSFLSVYYISYCISWFIFSMLALCFYVQSLLNYGSSLSSQLQSMCLSRSMKMQSSGISRINIYILVSFDL